MTIDLTSGWSVQTNATVNGLGAAAPSTLPGLIGSSSPAPNVEYVVRFITEQGATLSLDGSPYFGLDGFSLGARVPVDATPQGLLAGQASFSPLTLSLGDAALNPTLFEMLTAGTPFKEIDVLGYQPVGGTSTSDLVSQDSFGTVLGGTLGIDPSGLATYVADYGTLSLRHSTVTPTGSVMADPSGSWSVLSNTTASSLGTAGPATLPGTIATASPPELKYVVRFIDAQGVAVTVDGAQYFALDGFSFGATQAETIGAQGPGAGKASFGALSLSLGDAGLDPQLFQTMVGGTNFTEVDVLGYQLNAQKGVADLVLQDSFGPVAAGTLSIDQSGTATYVADYGTLSLQHSTINPDGLVSADPAGSWSVVTNTTVSGFGTAGPSTLPGTIAVDSLPQRDQVVRFITEQGTTLTVDGAQYFGLDGFSFAATQPETIGARGVDSGAASFDGLTLSLGDAALNPALFVMLASGTPFREVDVLGYQAVRGTGTEDLVAQDDFGLVAGGTLNIDQSGLATYVAQYGTLSLQHSTIDFNGSVSADPASGWSVVSDTTVNGVGAAAPSTLPGTIGPASPLQNVEDVVRFITEQGATLTLNGAQYFGVDGFSFAAAQAVSLGTLGIETGKVGFGALTLSLGDAALDPTLFGMLAAGTPFEEVDVLGYQLNGATGVKDLVLQDSFGLVAGGTIGIDQSGTATYVAQYATLSLQTSTLNSNGSVAADASAAWSVATNTTVNGFGAAGPSVLPHTIGNDSPATSDELVRFITEQGTTLTLNGARYFALDGFSFAATQPETLNSQGVGAGKVSFGALSLSLGDAALDPQLFQTLASGTPFKEVDVLGYQRVAGTDVEDLVLQDSFGLVAGTGLSIDQSGTLTYVADYGTLSLQHSTINPNGSVSADPSGSWSVLTNATASGFGTAGPATLPATIASASSGTPEYVARFITEQGATLTLDGEQYFGLDGFSFGAAQAVSLGTQAIESGKVSFDALSLSLGDQALNPTLFQTLAAGMEFKEVDVLGYEPVGGSGSEDLVLQDSFRSVLGGTLSIDASGLATYVAHYGTLSLGVDSNALQQETACFAAGTRIATARGEVEVEALRVGDALPLARGGMAAVRWLGHRRVDCARHPRPHDVLPVRVLADAFGPGQPRRDLLLSPDHAVFVHGVLIPVRHLLNGATVVRQTVARVTYWHVELDHHDVLLAEGLACETYLDTGNRAAFDNGGGAAMLHPDFAPSEFASRVWQRDSCARLVTSGAALAAARARLLARAAALGFTPTPDADLRLRAGRALLRPHAVSAGLHRFTLPQGTGPVVLASRSSVPAEMAATDAAMDGDFRRLGVAVARILLDGAPVPLDDARLGAGWHAIEPDAGGSWRWTDGAAQLDATGARALAIDVAITRHYWQAPRPAPARRATAAAHA